jgi:DnaJ-class molecular chaperone
MNENFYNVLEVPETATIDEIKNAYRKLSMIYHPDKNKNSPESTAKFQKLSEAYETLGDPDKKKEYDMTRSNPFFRMMNGNSNSNSNSAPNPMEDIFANLFGIPFAHMNNQNTQFSQGASFGPNVRIFHNGMPVNLQGFSQTIQKPTPIIQNVTIPIDKILTGTTIPLDIERWLIQDGNKVFEKETIYVTIPKGIDDGEIVVLRDKGNILREDCKGDVKLFIKIDNDTEFKRSGLDLLLDKTITVKEALCGFSFELKYITGKNYTINNNSGNIISHGYRKIIPNMGFTRENHTGNLIIMFNVKFPEKLSDDVLDKLKKIDF